MQNTKRLMILNYISTYNLSLYFFINIYVYTREHELKSIFYFLQFLLQEKVDHEIYQRDKTNLIKRKIDFIPKILRFKRSCFILLFQYSYISYAFLERFLNMCMVICRTKVLWVKEEEEELRSPLVAIFFFFFRSPKILPHVFLTLPERRTTSLRFH